MSGWHSLSGYLHFKPGGAFQKLKTKKKLWFVFEENRGQLLYYKNEADSNSASPIDSLDIKDAAIILDLEQQNQFIIMCKGKDYIFRAENHESMMIWLLGLQAKQEIYSCTCCAEDKLEPYENTETYNREKLYQRGIIQSVSNNAKTSVKTHPENTNSTPDSVQLRPAFGKKLVRVRSLPPLLEGDAESPSLTKKTNTYNLDSSGTNSRTTVSPQVFGGKTRSSSLDKDEGDAFSDAGDEIQSTTNRGRSGKRNSVTGESIRIVTRPLNSLRHSCLKKPVKEFPHMNFSNKPTEREQDLEEELIESKCEMAKVLNTLTGYQEALSRKDLVILRLDQRVEELELNIHHNSADRKLKEIQEQIRILQNKNRFLNKEVRRLAISRQQEQMKFTDQFEETKLLESEVESWKRDYVTLIQSSLHFPNNECTEEPKFVFYGCNHHKEKVCELLEEARKINPGLPLFESLMNQQIHVDSYGFKHTHHNEDTVVHYICQQLALHYSMQLEGYESRQLQFKYFCQNLDNMGDEIWKSHRQMKVLKVLCRKGIPDQFRKKIWHYLINKRVEDLMMEKGSHYFSNLINIQADCNSSARYRRQIFVDLLRTMPNNVKFSTAGSKGIMDLRDVLLAYCVHNPVIGYCQGMNFFAAMCLLFLNTEDAFWSLVAITECYFPEHYFDYNLIGAQADQALLKDMLKETLPKLSTHLENNDIELSTVTLTWFMSLFFDSVPFQTLLRIWDCFFVEGPKVLFRFALGLLKMHEQQLLQQLDTISVMRHLKCCAKLTFDIEGLVKNSFEKIRPFPKRHMIASRQAHYQSIIRERYRRQLRNRQALLLDDDTHDGEEQCEVDPADCLVEQALSVQSADICSKGNAWFCYGKQSYTVVFEVKCQEGIMYELPIKFDTRVLCAQAISSQIFLFGTLSCLLYAYDIESRQRLWELRVHDAVLCLNFLHNKKDLTVFAGLADGNLAVIEGVSDKQTNQVDILYTSIHSAPVTALLITGKNIWCASANRIFVLSALSLDSVCSFMLSKNPYDVVRCMKSSEHGIWITVIGSSAIELWDPVSMTCKMKYDIRTGQYPYPQEDEEQLNMQRITWFLPHQDVLWVGSGDGNLTIFEVVALPLKNKTVTDTDTDRNSDNDVLSPCKEKPMGQSSSNWCSKKSQESQSISQVTDDIFDEVKMGLKDFQHSLSPIRGSPDGQASNHTLNCSSEFKKDLKDGRLTICADELSPLSEIYAQNQLELIDDPTVLTGDAYTNQNMSCVVGNKTSQTFLGYKGLVCSTLELNSTNSVKDEKQDCLSQNPKLNSTISNEEQRMKNFPIETFKNSKYDSSEKSIPGKYAFCNDQQMNRGFPDSIHSSNVLNEDVCDLMHVSGFEMDSNPDEYHDSKISENSVTQMRRWITSKRPFLQRHNSDSMIGKSRIDLNARTWQHNSKLKNVQFYSLSAAELDQSKFLRQSASSSQNMSLDSVDQWTEIQNRTVKRELSLDDVTLAKLLNMKGDNQEKNECHFMTVIPNGLPFQDVRHDNCRDLTKHEIKKRRPFKKSHSTESSDSAKYVYPLTSRACRLAEVHHPSKQNLRCATPISDFKLNRGGNPAIQRLHSLDQKYVKLKKQESSMNSEMYKKLDEKSKREKALIRQQTLRSSIAVDSGKTLEKYVADHEARYRLEFSNYQVNLSLPLTSESSESETNTSEKNITESDVVNIDESNIPSIDLESLDGSYSQKLDNFLEANSNSSQRSSVEIMDVCGLSLMARLKISDHPIGCLLETIVDEKPLILSFSGFYGDDEPVLRWTQEASDKMWTNEPLQEICPITKVAKPYGYMKNFYQINKRTPSHSHEKQDFVLTQYQYLRRKLSKTF